MCEKGAVTRGRFIPACAGNRLDAMYLIAETFRRGRISTGILRIGDDHGNSLLTTLLVGGAAKLTSFRPSKSWGIR